MGCAHTLVESTIINTNNVHQVWSVICSKAKGKEKLSQIVQLNTKVGSKPRFLVQGQKLVISISILKISMCAMKLVHYYKSSFFKLSNLIAFFLTKNLVNMIRGFKCWNDMQPNKTKMEISSKKNKGLVKLPNDNLTINQNGN